MRPSNKVAASAVGAALATIVGYYSHAPAEVAVAMATLATFALGYFVPDRSA